MTVNLATNVFIFNGLSNTLTGFNSASVLGNGDPATLVGNDGANTLVGGAGNDTLTGGKGNDTLDGGAGIDTAIYSGAYLGNGYTISPIVGGPTPGILVTDNTPGRDGTDTVTNVEFLQFTDGTYNVGTAVFTPTGPADVAPVVTASAGTTASFEQTPIAIDPALTVTDVDSANLVGATVSITGGFQTGEDLLAFTNQNGITGSYNSTTGVLTLSGSASVANYQAALRSVTYDDTSNTPNTTSRTVSFTANDGILSSTIATKTVSVTPVNDAPTLSATAVGGTFTEGAGLATGTPVSLFSGAAASTVESGQLISGLTFTVSGVADASNEQINFDGSTISLVNGSGTTTNAGLSYTVTLVGGTATVAISTALGISAGSAANLVNAITYQDSSQNPTAGNRVVTLTQIKDNGGTANGGVDTTTLSINSTVNVVGTDDAPVVVTSAGTTAESAQTPIAIDPALTVTDVDSTNLTGATISITGGFQAGEDKLIFADQNGIAGAYNSTTGVLTLAGNASVATYQTALRSVTYDDTSGAPNTANRTISFTANDGTLNSAIATKTVTISAGETYNGTGGDDTHVGTAFNDTLYGNGGNDTLTGGGGNDFIDGGGNTPVGLIPGVDTALYSSLPTVGNITPNGTNWTIAGPDGTDTLVNVEALQATGGGPRILLVGSGGFDTIEHAVEAAVNGDTILIAPGTYAGNITVDKQVNIVGLGNPGDVVIHGSFATDNGLNPADPKVNEFLQNHTYSAAAGDGITVAADGVTLSNLTVEDFNNAVTTLGDADHTITGLTLNGVTMQHSVIGFNKPDDTGLSGLTINNSTFNDGYIGVNFANDAAAAGGPGSGLDATDTTITNSDFQDLTDKGIYTETLQGTTLFDGITMDNVGQFGTGTGFGGTHGGGGNGIDLNLKYHAFTGSVGISDFNLTDTGSSTGTTTGTPPIGQAQTLFPNGNTGGGAIVLEARDDGGSYSPIPADASGLNITLTDGTIDGTSTGVRTGEPGKNNAGPAVTVSDVAITNVLQNQIDNQTNPNLGSLFTLVDGDNLGDTYIASPTSTSAFAFYGGAGNDTFIGGPNDDTLQGGAGNDVLDGGGFDPATGGGDTADYSDATSNGLIVNLMTGTSSGGGLGNDMLSNIQNLTGSAYNDTLVGDGNDNILSSGEGNNVLFGHGGANILAGGTGTDVAYYSGRETDNYSITDYGFGNWAISGGPEDVGDSSDPLSLATPDTLSGIERLKFLAPSHVSDVTDTGPSDLVFQNATGDMEIRRGQGAFDIAVPIGNANLRAVGTGQFDPDNSRQAGILLQNTATGALSVVTDLTNTQTVTSITPIGSQPGVAWKAIATGDFNGDASSDVLLQNTSTNAVEILFLKENATDAIGTVNEVASVTAPAGSNWKVIAAGDFNGDGKSDILWQNSTSKAVEIYEMNGSTVINTPVSLGATGLTAVGTGDFNGDGNSDILFKNASGQAVVWFMNGDTHTGTKTLTKPGANFTVSGAADVDGNGYSDVIWSDTTTNPAVPATSATLLGGPSSAVSTTVLNSNFGLTTSSNAFHLIASTGGG